MEIKKKVALILDRTVLTCRSFNSAIIVAGGSGSRVGDGIPKQHRKINGVQVVALTVGVFEKCPIINEIIIVCRPGEEKIYEKYIAKYSWMKVTSVVVGGETRFGSVLEGFKKISDKSEFVYIHDAARCLVTNEIIESVGHEAAISGAAIAASRPIDSCKTEENGKLVNIDRNKVWLAATPQVFKTELYRAAAYMALQKGISVTDDASVAESAGFSVIPVDCGRENIKITEPIDFLIAETILKGRKSKNE